MNDDGTDDLLNAWRDAAAAAELAERLSTEAVAAARGAAEHAAVTGEVARLAGEVATAATRAAEMARVASEASGKTFATGLPPWRSGERLEGGRA